MAFHAPSSRWPACHTQLAIPSSAAIRAGARLPFLYSCLWQFTHRLSDLCTAPSHAASSHAVPGPCCRRTLQFPCTDSYNVRSASRFAHPSSSGHGPHVFFFSRAGARAVFFAGPRGLAMGQRSAPRFFAAAARPARACAVGGTGARIRGGTGASVWPGSLPRWRASDSKLGSSGSRPCIKDCNSSSFMVNAVLARE